MSKITGLEAPNQVPPKVTAMYRAVSTLLREDKDISEMSVSMITGLAGIGKGTARSEERRVGKECRSRWSPYH